LKQENLSMEEYYTEMKKAMTRANVYEDEEQSIVHFKSCLHRNIQCIVESQQYHNLIELVHQASKVESQLQHDTMISGARPFNVKGTTSARKCTPRGSAGRCTVNNSSGGSYSNARGTSKSKGFIAPSERNKPTKSSSTSMGSTTKSSSIQCFKCHGCGHVIRECPNKHTIIINDKGKYDSASEEEQEVNDERKFQDTFEEEDHTYYEFETSVALFVTQILSAHVKEVENGQQHNVFQTSDKVEGKVCKVIIDGIIYHNLASKEMIEKLGLNML
jgi:hypothetical protein